MFESGTAGQQELYSTPRRFLTKFRLVQCAWPSAERGHILNSERKAEFGKDIANVDGGAEDVGGR